VIPAPRIPLDHWLLRGIRSSRWLETEAVFHYWRKTGDIPHCRECGNVALVLYRWQPPWIFQSMLCFIMGQAFYCDDCAQALKILPKGTVGGAF
jgi:hypothetical protein